VIDDRRGIGLGGHVSEKEYWDGDDGGDTGTEGGGRGGTGLFIRPCVGEANDSWLGPRVDGNLFEDDLEYDSPPPLFALGLFCSESFSVNFDIILCNRPPLAFGTSKDSDIELPLMETSGVSGGPSAKNSIKSRALADTAYLVGCCVGFFETTSSSFELLPITSSNSSEALLRTTFRVRDGRPVAALIF
jgi:hypothetical protein